MDKIVNLAKEQSTEYFEFCAYVRTLTFDTVDDVTHFIDTYLNHLSVVTSEADPAKYRMAYLKYVAVASVLLPVVLDLIETVKE